MYPYPQEQKQGTIALQAKHKNGVVDQQNIILMGDHTRGCCIIKTVESIYYYWEGKHPGDESTSKDQNLVDNRPRFFDVSDKMVREVDALCTANLTLHPLECWDCIRQSMDRKYPSGWAGKNKKLITDRIRRTCSSLNHRDKFRTTDNTSYEMMTDKNRPFLQHHSTVPDRENIGHYQHMMAVGKPILFVLLQANFLDLYMDATFDCFPNPFYQCLTITTFDGSTNKYMPILYILMTHKTEEHYWHAFSEVFVISNLKINVHSYTNNFERAIINSALHQFFEGFHIGCLFHLKQSWRSYLISKRGFVEAETVLLISVGVLLHPFNC